MSGSNARVSYPGCFNTGKRKRDVVCPVAVNDMQRNARAHGEAGDDHGQQIHHWATGQSRRDTNFDPGGCAIMNGPGCSSR